MSTRLIHLTDPHLSSLASYRLIDLRGKRWTGYWSWTRRRRHRHPRAVLDRLARAVRAENADWLLLSGDLVQIGLESEIREAADWLAGLAPPERVLFVPGNHDVYAGDSWDPIRRHWRPWLPGDDRDMHSGYPLTRETDSLLLIGASSACPTPALSARGALGDAQLARLRDGLEAARDQGRPAVLAIHHPPLVGMTGWRKALREVREMQSLIAATQPALVVCGHLHHNMAACLGATRVFATASASSASDASYRVFDVEAGGGKAEFRMRLETIASGGETFRTAGTAAWKV